MNRRIFVGKAALAGLGTLACGKVAAAEKTGGREIAVFTKFLEKLSFDELAETIAPLGVAGLEAPLRKGGHIEYVKGGDVAKTVEAMKNDLATVRKWLG